MCEQESLPDKSTKIYTRKELVGNHIYAKASDMANATKCTYPQSEHALPHWKRVFRCCADCPCINITDQETTKEHDKTTPSIRFHIYHIMDVVVLMV